MEVMIRSFDPKTDEPFIFDSWTKGLRYGDKTLKRELANRKEWFTRTVRDIAAMLSKAHVRVACLKEDPSTILGYAVFYGDHFEWAYVKKNYREEPIMDLLLKGEKHGERKNSDDAGRAGNGENAA